MKGDRAPVLRRMADLKKTIAEIGAKRVVLANGCFDPLHVGHARYLSGAKEYGDFLVVAINDDKSTHALKGKGRPVSRAADRAAVVSSLSMVDAVLVFSARSVNGILRNLRPAFHAKGTDYTEDSVPELETSKRLAIETVIVGDPKSHASRDVVERIVRRNTRRRK
jgi:rfaE bifunctional protein nucleotidyltransferase chain/domain